MEYSTDNSFTSPAGTTCTDTATEVAPGTYYVRFKADANHNAGTVSAALVVPAYGATPYSITVNNDGNGNASADKTSAVAGETVTLTATPSTGYVFDKWVDKTPTSLTIVTGGTFTMPSGNVIVKATFKPAALTGPVNITGTEKFGQTLTADTTGITNNTGTLIYKWYRGSDEIIGATGSTYTLRAEDINKTITVKVSSDVQTGEITSSATGIIKKADGPAAPAAFTLTFTPNADGTTFTATIPTVTGGEYSFDGATYSTANTKTDCAANTSCTGYARIAETSTHKASAPTSSTQTSPKLTVATPTFTPNGVSSFTGMQSVTISCATVGATIHYTKDGTDPTASSPVYSTPLSLTSTTTVKAIAVMTDMNDSAIATATFTKSSGGGGGGGGSYTPSYTVSVDKTENGTITVSPKSASKGDAVTITVKPDKGYELDTLKVLDKNGDKVKLTEKNGKYTFTMPTGKVTVKGSFVEEAPVQIFKDVPVDAYYYEAVKWAAEKGITGGIGNGLFAPNQPCTRAQIVTFLWRAAGSPAPKNTGIAFGDVKPGSFYEQAVAWAVENGITGGTGDGKFSPDATCTRAQSVTFLYRAAGSPKVSSSAEFGDVATNAYYADAVAWAAKNGITGGIGGGLFGSGSDCTRAQIVTFLYRNYQSK
nr:S-layer homology domain-containing protein [Dysosmobacter acutus]